MDQDEMARAENRKPADATAKELVGTIADILWAEAADDPNSSGGVIAKLRSGECVKGQTNGQGALEVGNAYRFLGRWQEHHQHGHQFAFQTFVKDVPHHHDGIIKYLVDTAPNVGRITAERLWHRFGPEAIATLRTQPLVVANEHPDIGLNEVQAQEAAEALAAVANLEKTRVDLFTLFAGRGFPGQLINVAINKWGARAPEIIRRNPFALLVNELPGCGFKRTDRMYLDLQFPPQRIKRQMLRAWHELRSDDNGHTWLRVGQLVEAIERAIPHGRARPVRACRLGVRAGWLAKFRDVNGALWFAETLKAKNEATIARKVLELSAHEPLLWPHVWEAADSPLSPHQKETAVVSLSAALGILAGTPGTGKTYTAAEIVRHVLRDYGPFQVAACAPTGKAAVRLTESMARYGVKLQATTIHRLLCIGRNGHDGKGWGFIHNETNPLPFRFMFVDEVSMLDTDLAAALLSACSPGTHVLWVGDPYQLPPVGHGAPLRDLIASRAVPCGELSEIRRNAGLIVHACAAIKAGDPWETCDRFDPAAGLNLRHLATGSSAESIDALKTILGRFRDSKKFDPVWETQVLVAVNQKSELSRVHLNKLLQAELNAGGQRAKENPFRVADKIICLRNSRVQLLHIPEPKAREVAWKDSEGLKLVPPPADNVASYHPLKNRETMQPAEDFLANGEIGRVVAVAPKVAVATFEGPTRTVKIPIGKLKVEDDGQGGSEVKEVSGCDFDLAYACTCHKLQGSESPVVICMIDDHPGAAQVASREWWYTAISRASQLCILIGKLGIVQQQCRRVSLLKRKTFLAEKLRPTRELAPEPLMVDWEEVLADV